ncbi:PAQR family membrane homeostasis protein TrhA [Patiriisocius hiemis]|uniref:Hemolysin III family protein n=1 Tax=Patiriisocius hiemis TaxID=3075604 RepID=A0ABU2YHU1_9FLAO|nr:hemolysin III family protein [Constantimarinum sp. W242]MDT0556825.1 hemolysin III family protein [Constantimarinum sp. W242]
MSEQTEREEKLNVVTHSIGFVLSVIGFVLLFVYMKLNTFESILAIVLYGSSLTTLYLSSSLYHYQKDPIKKLLFRKLDHISIYLLIAGTYSPVLLLALQDSLGWTLFYVVWGIAIVGSILKIFFTGRFEILSLLFYLVMGWLIVFDFSALKATVPIEAIYLLIAGGLAYTVGIVFYAIEKIPFNHVIWHLFVLAGSIFHYLFILLYII